MSIFEVKVSRGDFLQEVRNKKYQKSLAIAEKFYYACPDGLIKPEEVPEGCRLYYLMDGYSVCVKAAKTNKVVELTEDLLWSIILSFEKKYVIKEEEILEEIL